jgi:hypothetical protein
LTGPRTGDRITKTFQTIIGEEEPEMTGRSFNISIVVMIVVLIIGCGAPPGAVVAM